MKQKKGETNDLKRKKFQLPIEILPAIIVVEKINVFLIQFRIKENT